MNLHVDRHSGTPIYLQIAQNIRDLIASGELKPGQKLPTVRGLFGRTGISEGTIRHAYGILAREGTLSLEQGRGTFVSEPSLKVESREARAMIAIDELLDLLGTLGFSPREMRMFLTLKLDAREDDPTLARLAFVDCNPESMNEAVAQLSDLPGIEVDAYLLEDARRAAGELLKDYSLIITTQTHAHELSTLLPDHGERIGRVVLSPSPQTITAIAQIECGSAIGIFCKTPRFAGIVKKGLWIFPHLRAVEVDMLCAGESVSLTDYLSRLSVLIVSPDYLAYAKQADREALSAFAESGGRIIPFHHRIDSGSLMYIEERIRFLTA